MSQEQITPRYRRLRPWGKYALISSLCMAVTSFAGMVAFLSTFSFTGPDPLTSFLFYLTLGFGIGALVFAVMAFGAGRDKLYASLALIGPGLLVATIFLLRFVLVAS